MKKILMTIMIVLVLTSFGYCRDLAGITWEEFKNRSEFVFSGMLEKAEILKDGPESGRYQQIEYTYAVWDVYKGPEIKSVTFRAPMEEDINKTVGAVSVVSLKKKVPMTLCCPPLPKPYPLVQ